ncbi:MAG: sugar transferase [Candidatus Enteromonas sp.]|nr:sugar transferase [Candidatus Enteromonas sp.]
MRTSQKLYLPLKRLIGIVGSFVGILFCAVLLWWWVIPVNAIVTKGHPFFLQERYGKKKKVFKMIKFRSMRVDANPNLFRTEMSEETQQSMVTKFGHFLRKTSIDETPQLLNIFVGHMAFIGPRPGATHNDEYLVECRERYTPNAYDVRPGLSGYAQVKMRREFDCEQKGYYDSEYVKKMNFFFDAYLFIFTVLFVFGGMSGR